MSKSNIKEIIQTHPFPTDYLETTHTISPIVKTDLELESTIYPIIFGKESNLISQWSRSTTTDPEYIRDTQQFISNIGPIDTVKPSNIREVWNSLYEDTNEFHDSYNYLNIDYFRFLNFSAIFLGYWTIINLASPILSLLIPFFVVIMPFFILKIRGIPITWEMYFNILKELAKNHAIGKLFSLKADSASNIAYALFAIIMYIFQIYQNVKSCIRFYQNIYKINADLIYLSEYLKTTQERHHALSVSLANCKTYRGFISDINKHSPVWGEIIEILKPIGPFKFSIYKMFEIGGLYSRYYSLHRTEKYREAIRCAVFIEEYCRDISHLKSHIQRGNMNPCSTTDTSGNTKFVGMYYPCLLESNSVIVKNDVDLSDNIVITGPNASGKTTILKSVLINTIISQQIGYGFYDDCELRPYGHIHSYLNIPDTSGRDSLFQAEARRCKEILDYVEKYPEDRHLCIFDELFSGTNSEEATESSYRYLKYLQSKTKVDFLLTTHFTELCERFEENNNKNEQENNNKKEQEDKKEDEQEDKKERMRIQNWKMKSEIQEENKSIKFHYLLERGISNIRSAFLILRELEFPEEIFNKGGVVGCRRYPPSEGKRSSLQGTIGSLQN